MMWVLCALWFLGQPAPSAAEIELRAVIHSVEDGTVLFKRPVTEAQKQMLRRRGVMEVGRTEMVTADSLHQGFYFFEYAMSSSVVKQSEVSGSRWVGKSVSIRLRGLPSGRYRVESIQPSE